MGLNNLDTDFHNRHRLYTFGSCGICSILRRAERSARTGLLPTRQYSVKKLNSLKWKSLGQIYSQKPVADTGRVLLQTSMIKMLVYNMFSGADWVYLDQ